MPLPLTTISMDSRKNGQSEHSELLLIIVKLLMASNRHCIFLGEDRLQFLRLAIKEDIMTFIMWILDNYLRLRKQSSLHQYFRQFRMLRRKCVSQSLHAKIMEDVNDVCAP